MAIEQLRPEILAIEAQLVSVYRRAQAMIDAQLSQLVSEPLQFRAAARLRELRDRIDMLVHQVDVQAASWINTQIPAIYRLGALDALPGAFSQIPTQAVSQLTLGTLRPLLEATTSVQNDVKQLLDRVSRDVSLEKLMGLRDVAGAAERMTELVADEAPSAITYANGAQVPLDAYAEMVVRTRTGIAYNSGTLDATKAGGTEYVEISDGPFCGLDGHDELPLADGMILTVDESYDHLLSHPNCIFAGTEVQLVGDVQAAYAAKWSGPCVRIATAGGSRLTIGPNHPVLTLRGWISADLLRVGDHVLRSTDHRSAASLASGTNCDVMPARVEDVFESLRTPTRYASAVATPADLHGDGRFCEGEIEVVWAEGELANVLRSLRVEQLGEVIFDLARTKHSSHARISSLNLPFDRIGVAASRRPSVSHVRGIGASVADGDTAVLEAFGESVVVAPQLSSEGFQTLAGFVALDEIVEIRYDADTFVGHAFDLETSTGMYFADSILVHNCRRAFLPRPDVTDPAQAEGIRQLTDASAAP